MQPQPIITRLTRGKCRCAGQPRKLYERGILALPRTSGRLAYFVGKFLTMARRFVAKSCIVETQFLTLLDFFFFFDILQPFADFSNEFVWIHLLAGKSISRPRLCPPNVFDALLVPCFSSEPSDRPSFAALARTLQLVLQEASVAEAETATSSSAGISETSLRMPEQTLIGGYVSMPGSVEEPATESSSSYHDAKSLVMGGATGMFSNPHYNFVSADSQS